MTDRVSWLRFEARLFRDDALEWLLLTGDRRLVSALQLGVLVTTVTAVVNSSLVPLRSDTPVLFLLFALIAGNFTLIAIVTSLSQFVLGRRLESPGEIRAEIDETVAYRRDVGETSGQHLMPVKPDAFLLQLYRNAREDLDSLSDVTDETRTKRTREELEDLVEGLAAHIDYVVALLRQPSSGLKHALFVTLTTDYENYVHRTWYLQTEYDDEYTDAVSEPLTRLTETLEHMVVATRLFKTTFIESEVAELSRYLLYVGLPAQIAAVLVTLFYTTPGTPPSVSHGTLEVLVPAVLTAGFAPFLVLSSYVVRLSVVARRTAESFPFSSQLDSALTSRGEFGDDA
ncbi:hypothetical protein EGH21_08040 [Halomicroarcula sp. F13]|uniref:Uncharacterized protein n=1 Tax=Haloarcula rubra TaxID=2487747 RepID=A0AAW4PP50_9EURY|nr:hypothetical protein [Halomicroarcula rubra]MBX0322976.1 hypothetical protein [Halomicroarcula rubra]